MLLIFTVVLVYSVLTVFLLAKLGSVPAQSVVAAFTGKGRISEYQKRQAYEQKISTR